MNLVFVDIDRESLLPFTFTKPVAKLRVGILTLEEKWMKRLSVSGCSYKTVDYLSKKFSFIGNDDSLYINAAVFPTDELVSKVQSLVNGDALYGGDVLIAYKGYESNKIQIDEVDYLSAPWDIFHKNGDQIRSDFPLMTVGKTSQKLPAHTTVIGDNPVFVEEGAVVNAMFLNTSDGPIYIGKDAEVMEGSVIRSPFALCEHGVVKMSAKIYGDTTIGPYCKVGGEVGNSVFMAYSNKGHDGYLGNSVIGEWCNLGADTNSSNLKNNYSPVRVWSFKTNKMEDTGLQFCGVLMGDHSKTGINTMLNTGTTVGVCANIFGGDFPEKFIPSFSWGGANGFVKFKMDKAKEVAERMMARRKVEFTQEDLEIFEAIQGMSKTLK